MVEKRKIQRILMILQNEGYPDDVRVALEAGSLRDAGYQVTVVCPRTNRLHKRYEVVAGVKVYRHPAPPDLPGVVGYGIEFAFSFTAALLVSFYLLLRNGFDVVHIHMPPDCNGFLGLFYRCLGKQFVMDHHDLSPELYGAQGGSNRVVRRTLEWLERRACRAANRLIATNESQKKVQIDRAGANTADCYVVRNGPNEAFLGPIEPVSLNVGKEFKIIGYVGMIAPQDGVDVLVRAAGHLKHDLGRHDFLCLIVGAGSALSSLKELAEDLELGENIRFTGMIPWEQVPSYIAAFDIATTPDPRNAYNDSCTTIKTMEYMSIRKPTVSFATTENCITAGDAAVVVAEDTAMAYAVALRDLMDDPGRRCKMGQSGRQRIEERYTWEHQSKELLKLYASLEN